MPGPPGGRLIARSKAEAAGEAPIHGGTVVEAPEGINRRLKESGGTHNFDSLTHIEIYARLAS